MPNRRQFLTRMTGATAGVLFGGPAVLRAARRQVAIKGRRVRVVDGHAHCTVPEALDVLKDTPLARSVSTAIAAPGAPLVVAAERVRQMDEQGQMGQIAILGGNLIKLLRLDPVS